MFQCTADELLDGKTVRKCKNHFCNKSKCSDMSPINFEQRWCNVCLDAYANNPSSRTDGFPDSVAFLAESKLIVCSKEGKGEYTFEDLERDAGNNRWVGVYQKKSVGRCLIFMYDDGRMVFSMWDSPPLELTRDESQKHRWATVRENDGLGNGLVELVHKNYTPFSEFSEPTRSRLMTVYPASPFAVSKKDRGYRRLAARLSDDL